MNPYENIPRAPFVESRAGLRVFKHTFVVPLDSTQNEFGLESKSAIEDQFVVGIWVVPPTSGGAATKGQTSGNTTSQAVFNSAYLSIQEGQTEIIRRVSLLAILAANNFGQPYLVNIAEIQMSQSKLLIFNPAGIATNDHITFTFDFLKLKPKQV